MANQLIGKLSVSGGSAPILDTLNVTTNGTYTPPSGTDGYNEVNVEVPVITPVFDTLNVTANGTYTPPSGVDGYNEVNVNVPSSAPVLDTLNVTTNGTYTPPSGTDGYNVVNVAVAGKTETTLNARSNGEYTPPPGSVYNSVNVNVDNKIVDGDSSVFFDSTHGMVVTFSGESVNQVESLASHYTDSNFYNIFKNMNFYCKVYDSWECTNAIGYMGYYNGDIRAWNLTLSRNINLTNAYGSIIISDADNEQQDDNGWIRPPQ